MFCAKVEVEGIYIFLFNLFHLYIFFFGGKGVKMHYSSRYKAQFCFCFVLFCFVLFCFVLICFVLICFVFCFVYLFILTLYLE